MAKKVLIVIGERMGKGNHVADGIRKAGGEAYVIPGMAADMKLGDVMHEKNADLGLSFCGSGGAGALMASNKYGYKCRHSMRSVDEGVTAIKDGGTVTQVSVTPKGFHLDDGPAWINQSGTNYVYLVLA